MEQNPRTALLLINVGTPDQPEVSVVRRYLAQFLNDPRVIDLPWLIRKILVNLIIVPFRAPKSTLLYQRLWTEKGSPLLFYTRQTEENLNRQLENGNKAFAAMRYGNPSIPKVLEQIRKEGFSRLIIFPLFPQYASSTSETAIQAVRTGLRKMQFCPDVQVIDQFYSHPNFLQTFADQIRQMNPDRFDHILFSYHGLPLSHIRKVHPHIQESQCSCMDVMPMYGNFCYKATCYETTRLLASRLNLPEGKYSTAFQSRLSKNWLTPFSDQVIRELAAQGKKRVLVVAPAFVTDCLETIIEIGEDYRDLFIQLGGEELALVESLNDSDQWIDAIREIVSL